jgi:hypothetical protein
MKGLLIKFPWVNFILEGRKTWEIRGSNTHIRGRVGIIQSGTGTVLGTVNIVDCIELTMEDYQQNSVRHCVTSERSLQLPYKKTYAWVLEDPIVLETPLPYKHPRGAVIWVDLEKATKGEHAEIIETESEGFLGANQTKKP